MIDIQRLFPIAIKIFVCEFCASLRTSVLFRINAGRQGNLIKGLLVSSVLNSDQDYKLYSNTHPLKKVVIKSR